MPRLTRLVTYVACLWGAVSEMGEDLWTYIRLTSEEGTVAKRQVSLTNKVVFMYAVETVWRRTIQVFLG